MRPSQIPLDWLPTLPRRYSVTVIDGLLMLSVVLLTTSLLPSDDELSGQIRMFVALVAIFSCEPICTGRFATLGQPIAKIRVHRKLDGKNR